MRNRPAEKIPSFRRQRKVIANLRRSQTDLALSHRFRQSQLPTSRQFLVITGRLQWQRFPSSLRLHEKSHGATGIPTVDITTRSGVKGKSGATSATVLVAPL